MNVRYHFVSHSRALIAGEARAVCNHFGLTTWTAELGHRELACTRDLAAVSHPTGYSGVLFHKHFISFIHISLGRHLAHRRTDVASLAPSQEVKSHLARRAFKGDAARSPRKKSARSNWVSPRKTKCNNKCNFEWQMQGNGLSIQLR